MNWGCWKPEELIEEEVKEGKPLLLWKGEPEDTTRGEGKELFILEKEETVELLVESWSLNNQYGGIRFPRTELFWFCRKQVKKGSSNTSHGLIEQQMGLIPGWKINWQPNISFYLPSIYQEYYSVGPFLLRTIYVSNTRSYSQSYDVQK